MGNAIPKQVLVFQMAAFTAEEVKCGCIYAIRKGQCYSFLLI
jgi:hypothetical protein